MIATVLHWAAAALAALYAALRIKYELQMLQQNSYRTRRYLRWLRTDLAAVPRITDAMLLAVLLIFPASVWTAAGVAAVAVLKIGKELGRKYKKPLVFTPRAVRIYVLGLLVAAAAILAAVVYIAAVPEVCAAAAALASPAAVLLSLWMLQPVEKAINNFYIADARRILAQMPDLKIIGITGSYGKTSTKYYLHRILSEKYNVLMTPGSYNTTLGVVRTIREQLKGYHDVFIVEMGAKQRGDVAEICRLVHPRIGILTAVGPQHLESFGSIENVQAAKFELIDSLPSDGLAILNDDFGKIAERAVTNTAAVRYATGSQGDYRIADVSYGTSGTDFTVCGPDGYTLPLHTRLAGQANLSNLLAGCIAARHMGLTDQQIRYAVNDVAQVEHRLSVRRNPGGITVLDDAFNSNPHGSKMALDTLAAFPGGKRIVITPGMIELGARQRECNAELGAYMTGRCDRVIVVGRYNREAILEGLASTGFESEHIFTADTLQQATAILQQIAAPGDTVLYENDLPDTFK